jgi:hypothetical protein
MLDIRFVGVTVKTSEWILRLKSRVPHVRFMLGSSSTGSEGVLR